MHFNVIFAKGSKVASREVLQFMLNLKKLLHKTIMWNSKIRLKESEFQSPCDRDILVFHSSL